MNKLQLFLSFLYLSCFLFCNNSDSRNSTNHEKTSGVFKSLSVYYYPSPLIPNSGKKRFHDGELEVGWTAIDSLEIIVEPNDELPKNSGGHIEVLYEKYITINNNNYKNSLNCKSNSILMPQILGTIPCDLFALDKGVKVNGFDIVSTIKYYSSIYTVDSFAITAYFVSDRKEILDKITEIYYR